MSNQEWDALAAQWDGMEVGDPALLQRRVDRHLRWNKLGLLGEGLLTLVALGFMSVAWGRATELRGWLIATALLLLVCQGLYLLMRHRYRLFGAPDGGLVGLIDAEIRRARYVVATQCIGIVLTPVLVLLGWVLIPAEDHAPFVAGVALGIGLSVAYMIPRIWQIQRRIRRLREERTSLVE